MRGVFFITQWDAGIRPTCLPQVARWGIKFFAVGLD